MQVHKGATSLGKTYRPDIQGLRALAIITVILFHSNSNLAPGRFIGVDVFFVISGYLITGIILGEFNEGCFRLAPLYLRRICRIFPALFLMLTFVSGAAVYFLHRPG